MAFVSVIMNIRNGAPYLREAIDSVLAQTHSDWELIARDDWSTDNSADIVKSYKDCRIRYLFSPEDTPLGRARSLACQHARGEWIAFLDQDDIWTDRKLELQLAATRDGSDIGLVYGRTVRFGDSITNRDFDHRHEFAALPQGAIFELLLSDSCFLAMSSAMLRTRAVREAGEVPPCIRMSPDYFYYFEVCARYEARAVEEVVCWYRVHRNNMTGPSWIRLHEECLWLIDRWSHRIRPHLAAHRRRVHHTLIAVSEFRRVSIVAGLYRLLRHGSIAYLLSRPMAIGLRRLRRKFQTPRWLTAGNVSPAGAVPNEAVAV